MRVPELSSEMTAYCRLEGLNPYQLKSDIDSLAEKRSTQAFFNLLDQMREKAPGLMPVFPWDKPYLEDRQLTKWTKQAALEAPSSMDLARTWITDSYFPSDIMDMICQVADKSERRDLADIRRDIERATDNYIDKIPQLFFDEGVKASMLITGISVPILMPLVAGFGYIHAKEMKHHSADAYHSINILRNTTRKALPVLEAFFEKREGLYKTTLLILPSVASALHAGENCITKEIEQFKTQSRVIADVFGILVGTSASAVLLGNPVILAPVAAGVGYALQKRKKMIGKEKERAGKFQTLRGQQNQAIFIRSKLPKQGKLRKEYEERVHQLEDQLAGMNRQYNKEIFTESEQMPWVLALASFLLNYVGRARRFMPPLGSGLMAGQLLANAVASEADSVVSQTIGQVNADLYFGQLRQAAALIYRHSRTNKESLASEPANLPDLQVKALPIGGRDGKTLHLRNCRIRAGKILSIVGPSGSGKTTLLRTIRNIHTLADPVIVTADGNELTIPQLYPSEETWKSILASSELEMKTTDYLGIIFIRQILEERGGNFLDFIRAANYETISTNNFGRPPPAELNAALAEIQMALDHWDRLTPFLGKWLLTYLDGASLGKETDYQTVVLDQLAIAYFRQFFPSGQTQLNTLLRTRLGTELAGSTGENNRIGLGLAMAQKAKVYLFDEPVANLDGENKTQIMRSIEQFILAHPDATFLIASHDEELLNVLTPENYGRRCSGRYNIARDELDNFIDSRYTNEELVRFIEDNLLQTDHPQDIIELLQILERRISKSPLNTSIESALEMPAISLYWEGLRIIQPQLERFRSRSAVVRELYRLFILDFPSASYLFNHSCDISGINTMNRIFEMYLETGLSFEERRQAIEAFENLYRNILLQSPHVERNQIHTLVHLMQTKIPEFNPFA